MAAHATRPRLTTSAGTGSPTRRSPPRDLGVRAETLYFVPLGETLEVWRLRVSQRARRAGATLSVFSSAEFCLWDAQDDATNFQRNYSTGEVEVADGVIYHKTEYRERRDHFAYFACSEPLAGFDTQREAFLGAYRGWDRPLAVERGESSNSVAHGWSPHGSHHVRLALGPGRDAGGDLPARLLGEPARTRSSTRRVPGSSTRPSSGRSSTAGCEPATVADGFAPAAGVLGLGAARYCRSSTPDTDTEPDGEHLEPVPVHGDVQHEPVGLAVRVRHRPRHGVPRLEPGPARLRAPGPRARPRRGSSTSPRRSSPPAAPTTSTSRSPSAATTTSGRASTTTRSGSSSASPPT